MQNNNELNSQILKMIMAIKDKYPELSKYLEELKISIPSQKIAEITREDLKVYFDSLNDLFAKYKLTHPGVIPLFIKGNP
jgi:hypothetical protein